MMRLPPFRYRAPRTVTEAARILAGEGPQAQFVAGGTDLFPNMKRRQQTPKVLVGLRGVADLRRTRGEPASGLILGSGLTLTEVCEDARVRSHYAGLARAVRSISTPLLRNTGTIGGNLCLDTRCNYYNQTYEWRQAISFCLKKDGNTCWVAPGSPRCWAVSSSDAAPLLVALGASVTLLSVAGGGARTRTLPLEDLYRDDGIDYLGKRPDELLTDILLPAVNGWRATYWKLRRRGAFDFPVLGVAGCLYFEGKRVREARIVFGGVASHPRRAREAEAFLAGKEPTEETIREAASIASRAAKALDNTDFAMGWRKKMAQVYAERMLRELAGLPIPGGELAQGPLGAGVYGA
ncbi:MAG: FAD binding domain-containing protein [Planctomycetes bacterium]|nr:FAD binding domain-containing protein [Planctomycetota bacterium]